MVHSYTDIPDKFAIRRGYWNKYEVLDHFSLTLDILGKIITIHVRNSKDEIIAIRGKVDVWFTENSASVLIVMTDLIFNDEILNINCLKENNKNLKDLTGILAKVKEDQKCFISFGFNPQRWLNVFLLR